MGLCNIAEIRMFAVNDAPWGWVPCDGRLLEKSEHEALFSLIGYQYGGSGAQFAVPDLGARMPLGPSAERPVAVPGGEGVHKLIEAEIPAHRHRVVGEDISAPTADGNQPGRNKVLVNSEPALWLQTEPPPPPGPDDPGDPEDPDAVPAGGAPDPPHAAPMQDLSISTVGASAAHQNLQPYVAVGFFMNTKGLLPTRS